MIRNYNENVLLESSGIALLLSPIRLQIVFYASFVIEFVLHYRFSAILVMQIIQLSHKYALIFFMFLEKCRYLN